jgi:predicted transcriptional regulator
MLTAKQIAALLGVTEQTVNRLARENKLGKLINARQRIYTQSDSQRIANVCNRSRGNPNFSRKRKGR